MRRRIKESFSSLRREFAVTHEVCDCLPEARGASAGETFSSSLCEAMSCRGEDFVRSKFKWTRYWFDRRGSQPDPTALEDERQVDDDDDEEEDDEDV
eukprot:900997-Rhodomonas_salina.1